MGVWATGSFESDTALDWLGQVYETGDFSLVRTALSIDVATAQPYLARKAVAAADLVACSRGYPPPEPKRQKLVEWTRQYSAEFTPDLLELARRAVATIKINSQLRDSWKDHDGVVSAEWLDAISDLERRLQG